MKSLLSVDRNKLEIIIKFFEDIRARLSFFFNDLAASLSVGLLTMIALPIKIIDMNLLAFMFVMHFSNATQVNESFPKVDMKTYSGFPAISKDGKHIAIVSKNHGDYGHDPQDITFILLDTNNRQIQKSEIRRGEPLNATEFNKSSDQLRSIADLLKKNDFSSLTPVASVEPNKSEKFVFGKYILKYLRSTKANSVAIETSGQPIQTVNLPLVGVRGVCAGDLEHPEKVVLLSPSLQQVWYSEKFQAVVIEYRVWGARDGCEGVENYMKIGLSK